MWRSSFAVTAVLVISSTALATEDDEVERAQRQIREAAAQYAKVFKHFASGLRLGVQISESKDGVVIDAVTPGSPAEREGLRAGDVLTALDGQSLTSAGSARRLAQLVRSAGADTVVTIDYLREGKKLQCKVKLGEAGHFAMKDFDAKWPFDGHGAFGAWSDLELAAINPDLGQYFGVTEGVLVVSAPTESATKLKAGDVILKIGARSPSGPIQAMRILKSYEPGEKFSLEIMRQKQSHTLTVELPARSP